MMTVEEKPDITYNDIGGYSAFRSIGPYQRLGLLSLLFEWHHAQVEGANREDAGSRRAADVACTLLDSAAVVTVGLACLLDSAGVTVGLASLLACLDVLTQLRNRGLLFPQPERFVSLGIDPPKGILLFGPPGAQRFPFLFQQRAACTSCTMASPHHGSFGPRPAVHAIYEGMACRKWSEVPQVRERPSPHELWPTGPTHASSV